LAQDHPREGFWKSYYWLRNERDGVNHKGLHRIYKKLGLPLRRKVKRSVSARVKETLEVPKAFNQTWSVDFVSDVLTNGRKFRSFNVISDYQIIISLYNFCHVLKFLPFNN
jgi:putative transposase